MDRKRRNLAPETRQVRKQKRRWIGWIALAVPCLAIGGYALWPTKTTFSLVAQSEEVWIHTPRPSQTDASVVGTSALTFGHVLLEEEEEDVRRSLDGVGVRVSPGTTIRLHRVMHDTLVIVLEADEGMASAGTVHRGEPLESTLGPNALFLVPLSREGGNTPFRLSFRARRLVVGNVAGFASGPRTPLLRSGEVKLSARTLLKQEYEAGSYTLRAGQRIDLPASESAADEIGAGLILVDEDAGMTVNFTTRAQGVAIAGDHELLRLAPDLFDRVFDRARNDWIVAIAWVLMVALFLAPLGSVMADRMKTLLESLINR